MKTFFKYFVIFFIFQFAMYYYTLFNELGIYFVLSISSLLSFIFALAMADVSSKIIKNKEKEKYINEIIQEYIKLIEKDKNLQFTQEQVDNFYNFLSFYKILITDERIKQINNHILRNFKDQ